MRIADTMITPPVTVPPGASARQAARRMETEAVGCVLVAEHDTLHGIVTDRDLALRVLSTGTDPQTPVSEIMSVPVVTVDVADELEAAYRAFRRAGVRRLPILDGDRLVGLLTVDDLFLDVLHRLSDVLGPVSWSALRESNRRPGPGSTPAETTWSAR
ncbi:CBS domain-containing protein [Kitasatospora sp. CM 4170]|uniref:CBS domain-containing protein n=1 Tax=Kitasatospora aburaviensis TaxID=67265 RepID=A0ABW1F728_9ACTN|nr:CBS domain-containing protein [Kitasatospora sp. CM 4170]WNM43344.1 CBS domain-containing protein [Kitasatospora sp. CM 4170]